MIIETAAAGKQIHPYIDELCCRLPIQEAPLDGWSRTRSPFGSFSLLYSREDGHIYSRPGSCPSDGSFQNELGAFIQSESTKRVQIWQLCA